MPLPDGFRVALDPGARWIGDGTVLVGGSPIRLLRLTTTGRKLVDRLGAGEPVPRSSAAQRLTRRLLDAGLAHPRPQARGPASPADVAVVIPVRNDTAGLSATLAALVAGDRVPRQTTLAPCESRAGTSCSNPKPGQERALARSAGKDGRRYSAGAPWRDCDQGGGGHDGRPGSDHVPADDPLRVVVVDDASDDPVGVKARCTAPEVTLLLRGAQGGPAAARNEGWRATSAEVIAFVDANCEPEQGWLTKLLPHFADPQVAAVAPRILPPTEERYAGTEVMAAYEAAASPLDLGEREAIVRPRSPVAYVPTAALVVRRSALEALGGFDEGLTVGEDVDFVWRLVAAGWTVRYEPRAVVRHPIRPSWRAWLQQRYRYGTSAAPLARRHGWAVAPAVVSPWTAAAWALVAGGQPFLGAAAAGYSVARLAGVHPTGAGNETTTEWSFRSQLSVAGQFGGRDGRFRLPVREAVRLAGLGHLRGGLALARAVRRAWAPAAVLLAVKSRRSRPALAAAVIVPGALEWLQRRSRLEPVRFCTLRLVDDLAYAAGVWTGCARERSPRALLPDLRSARGGSGGPN